MYYFQPWRVKKTNIYVSTQKKHVPPLAYCSPVPLPRKFYRQSACFCAVSPSLFTVHSPLKFFRPWTLELDEEFMTFLRDAACLVRRTKQTPAPLAASHCAMPLPPLPVPVPAPAARPPGTESNFFVPVPSISC